MGGMMTERAIVEYVVNEAWQIPLLALGAWALIKAVKPRVQVEHLVWVTVLALAVALPMRGTAWGKPATLGPMDAVVSVELERAEIALMEERAAHGPHTVSEARQTHWWDATRERGVRLNAAATRWVVGLYGATMLLGALRFAWACVAARRLVRRAREIAVPQEFQEVVAACGARMGAELPGLRESTAISGPLVVGAMRPVLMVPAGFWEHTEDEVRAAMLHELAHVRRRDYLVNMVCHVAALPVAWHPVVRAVERRIRLTREMACDAMAAEQMRPGASYARCLVAMARQMLPGQTPGDHGHTQALGLFERGTMEERVMRLMETSTTEKMNGRAKALRLVAGVMAMLCVVMAAAIFHLRPTFAATVEREIEMQRGSSGGSPVEAAAVAAVSGQAFAPAASFQAKLSNVAIQAKLSDVTMAAPAAALQQVTGASALPPAANDEPTATAGKGDYVHRWVGSDGRKYVVVNRNPKEPNADERRREEQSLRDPLKQLDDALKMDDSKLKLQMEELQKGLANIDVKQQIDAAKLAMNDPQLKRQMAELQKQMNDPAWLKQIAEAAKDAQLQTFQSAEWQKQFAEMQKDMANVHLEGQLEMAKSSLDRARIDAQVNGEVNMQMKGEMAKARKELESGELKAKLDAAQKMLDEVREQMLEMQKK